MTANTYVQKNADKILSKIIFVKSRLLEKLSENGVDA